MTTSAASSFPHAYRRNLEALLRAQKPSRGTAAYSRYVNRPTGRRVAAAAHVLGISPNGASVVSALLSGSALLVLALARPGPATGLAVALLLAAGYVVDSVDGQLARLRGTSSVSGEWLDHTIDAFKTSSLHLALLISWYRHPPVDTDIVLLAPLLYEVVQVVTYFGLILMPYLRTSGLRGRVPTPVSSAPEHPLRPWLILPTDYGFLVWVFVLMAWPAVFASVYSALAVLNAAVLAVALRKWWGELRDLDRSGGGSASP